MRSRLAAIAVLAALGGGAGVARADGGPIMPLSQVQAGMSCTADTVVQGTTISSFDVQILGVVNQTTGQGARILISVSGPAVAASGIAEGFSGSPVYCPSSTGTMENIGAISEGVGQYGNNVGLVTPIQQMLGEQVYPPSSAPHTDFKTRPLLGPLTVAGLSPSLMALVEAAGQRSGRLVVAAPSDGVPDFAPQPLIPGASVAASYSSGAVAMGAVGTVTYRDGNDVYMFGHELDAAGRRSLLLQDAYVYGVIDNPDPALEPSYKLANPGHTLGTITSDTPNAVIGVAGAPPGQIPVNVTAHDLDTGNTIVERTEVADETDVGFPLGTSLLDMVAPLAIGQGAIDIYNGPPANESGTMCLQIGLREHNTELHFCDRYVGTGPAGDANANGPPEVSSGAANDVTTALSLLDSVQFATLHVTSVSADIDASRGLAEAAILAAKAPLKVKPGQLVAVHLKIQLYRSSIRTIALKVRIPTDARGLESLTIRGAPSLQSSGETGGSLGSELSIVLGGGVPSSGPAPGSLAALRKEFAAIPFYDGIETRFGSRGSLKHAYRDPSLLITGRATVRFALPGKAHAKAKATANGGGFFGS
jgi:hypothetical protein